MKYPFGFISDGEVAKEIIRVLKFDGIPAGLDLDQGRYVLFVENEGDVPRATEIYFQITGLGRSREPESEEVRERYPLGPVSLAFLVLSVCGSFLFFFKSLNPYMELLFIDSLGKEMFTHVKSGEVWRLITPVFLHFGFLHILFNGMWMKELGSLIELGMGPVRFLIYVVVSGIISNILQYYVAGPNFGGLSGVVYSLLGLVICLKSFDERFPFELPKRDMILMGVWYVLCMFGVFGPIANMAHGGGLVIGVLYGVYYGSIKQKKQLGKGLAFISSALVVLAITAGVEFLKMKNNFYFQLVPFDPKGM